MALEVPLRLSGYDVSVAGSGREAVSMGASGNGSQLEMVRGFDVVLTDILCLTWTESRLSAISGASVLRHA
jgi:DNA-binding response OmpR family regulator